MSSGSQDSTGTLLMLVESPGFYNDILSDQCSTHRLVKTINSWIELIHQLFSAADQINLPLWLQGGWAIDAKLNRITRDHEDIGISSVVELLLLCQ